MRSARWLRDVQYRVPVEKGTASAVLTGQPDRVTFIHQCRVGQDLGVAPVDGQRRDLERAATVRSYDRERQSAISMLADPRVRDAFDVTHADEKSQRRYGANSFGWSLLKNQIH